MVCDEGEVYDVGQSYVTMRVGLQVMVVKEGRQEHLEKELVVVRRMLQEKEAEELLEVCSVRDELRGERKVFVNS